ncbi:hypothetical protein BHE74_00037728 [Ensete ventricosum]|nr:hypothetical protein BHE74_00037728 [Ensete ventricosum]
MFLRPHTPIPREPCLRGGFSTCLPEVAIVPRPLMLSVSFAEVMYNLVWSQGSQVPYLYLMMTCAGFTSSSSSSSLNIDYARLATTALSRQKVWSWRKLFDWPSHWTRQKLYDWLSYWFRRGLFNWPNTIAQDLDWPSTATRALDRPNTVARDLD